MTIGQQRIEIPLKGLRMARAEGFGSRGGAEGARPFTTSKTLSLGGTLKNSISMIIEERGMRSI
jgi:hypothetical protein